MDRQLPCPTCGRRIEWSQAYPYRPFCSERCRLIDLGDWLMEKNVIAGETAGEAGPGPTEGGSEDHDDWPSGGGQRRI
ncbi:MAG TPA: DNA gyrase inhibitor YacG [Steroidobacteraceae bacterium]|nr:DNA gyrase inhibitor YacG [Steroidobacteraceae bacterium]